MKDEIWTTRDGRKIAVNDMSEEHVRSALRMVIRAMRRHNARVALRDATDALDGQDAPDNRTIIDGLRRQHGDALTLRPCSAGGMSGSNAYIGDRKVGWFGGV